MKRNLFLMLGMLLAGSWCGAQVHYYTYTPWKGDKMYSLNVGISLPQKPNVKNEYTDLKTSLPWNASFRYEGEATITEHLSWGYQGEIELGYYHWTYKEKMEDGTVKDQGPSEIDLAAHVRLALDYYFSDQLELTAAAGVYMCISRSFGLSANLGLNYYLTDSFFAGANLRYGHSFSKGEDSFMSSLNSAPKLTDTFSLLVGVGFRTHK